MEVYHCIKKFFCMEENWKTVYNGNVWGVSERHKNTIAIGTFISLKNNEWGDNFKKRWEYSDSLCKSFNSKNDTIIG